MTAIILFSFIIPITIGYLLVCLAWPGRASIFKYPLIKFSLGTGLGFGIASLFFMAWVFVLGPKDGFVPSVLTELVLLFTAAIIIALRISKRGALPQLKDRSTSEDPKDLSMLGNVLRYSIWAVLLMSIVSFIGITLRYPNGGWDAVAIWNMHARFLFRGGADWVNLFSPALAWWIHADYPFLIPGMIARCWEFIGKDPLWVPAGIAFFFTLAAVGVVSASLSMVKGRLDGLLGGVLVMGTPFFIKNGAMQYADIPLSFFFCASLALFCIVDHSYDERQKLLPLTGLLAAFAAWTKNEGIVFLILLMAARFVIVTRVRGLKASVKEANLLAIGVMPVALILVYFKLHYAPSSDFFTGDSAANLTDLSRYFFVLEAFKNKFFNFGAFYIGAMPLLLLYLFMSGIDAKKDFYVLLTPLITLVLMAGSYFFAYLISPYDLNWHIQMSIERLFFQIWPSMIFLTFMLAKPIELKKRYP